MGVDIISMSWTFSVLGNHRETELIQVINDAHDAKILTFASASDQGFNRSSGSYPGKISGVFCIGAAKVSGVADDAASSESHFVFPGGSTAIKSPRITQVNSTVTSDVVFGSSFATAVASGLAALILCCVEMCPFRDKYRNELRQHKFMNAIFKSMASHSPKSSYIDVQSYFPPIFADKDVDEDRQDFEEAVAYIIRYVLEFLTHGRSSC